MLWHKPGREFTDIVSSYHKAYQPWPLELVMPFEQMS